MANAYICSMCGQPILDADHMEGYHGQLKTWQPLHEKCAEVLDEIARADRPGRTRSSGTGSPAAGDPRVKRSERAGA